LWLENPSRDTTDRLGNFHGENVLVKTHHQELSECSKQDQPEEICEFSLVGFDNPERENGVEGAFLGVKSPDAVRLHSGAPSDSLTRSKPSAPAREL
jgi:hypothetical protein